MQLSLLVIMESNSRRQGTSIKKYRFEKKINIYAELVGEKVEFLYTSGLSSIVET